MYSGSKFGGGWDYFCSLILLGTSAFFISLLRNTTPARLAKKARQAHQESLIGHTFCHVTFHLESNFWDSFSPFHIEVPPHILYKEDRAVYKMTLLTHKGCHHLTRSSLLCFPASILQLLLITLYMEEMILTRKMTQS